LRVGRQITTPAAAGAKNTTLLAEISRLGGGVVESYPEDTAGRKVSASFLNNGTMAMFERHGFDRIRRIGKHRWVVTQVIE
jgi:hypothetical protein